MSRRHRALMNHEGLREILNVSAQTGVISERWMNPITNMATTVARDGGAQAMEFNGVNSLINCGNIDSLVGDRSFALWSKGYEYSTVGPYLLGNTMFALAFDTSSEELSITSDGGGTIANDAYMLPLNEYTFITVTRTADGLIDFYENGALLYSELDTGTPEAGTDIKINVEPAAFRGLMSDVRVYSGLLLSEEISGLWTNERNKYSV